MRHGFIQMNVIYKMTNLQSRGYNNKIEILIQKIKVNKLDFKLYFLKNESDRILVYTALRRKT